jgi:hypothetical protein
MDWIHLALNRDMWRASMNTGYYHCPHHLHCHSHGLDFLFFFFLSLVGTTVIV